MLAQYWAGVLSTALNSLVAGLTSHISALKIWSTKSAKKRHLCASISAHSLHRCISGLIKKSWTDSTLEWTSLNTFKILIELSSAKKSVENTWSNCTTGVFHCFSQGVLLFSPLTILSLLIIYSSKSERILTNYEKVWATQLWTRFIEI